MTFLSRLSVAGGSLTVRWGREDWGASHFPFIGSLSLPRALSPATLPTVN